MKQKLLNPAFLFIASLLLPLAAYEALINETAALFGVPISSILFALFAAVMILIIARK
ncbi:hypothetical protein [Thalassospira alkalitolerans]|uniref:hypothetical protein n=1 Tax=Thalassospira alkalitolerans TaxID=1293890 RepID=UPI003AA8FAF1